MSPNVNNKHNLIRRSFPIHLRCENNINVPTDFPAANKLPDYMKFSNFMNFLHFPNFLNDFRYEFQLQEYVLWEKQHDFRYLIYEIVILSQKGKPFPSLRSWKFRRVSIKIPSTNGSNKYNRTVSLKTNAYHKNKNS